jgi:hypothetical protein
MEKYVNNGKTYDVEEVNLYGAIINVNGTSITDLGVMKDLTGDELLYGDGGYTVFCDSDEIYFDTFDKVYNFAMTEQKNTFSLEK